MLLGSTRTKADRIMLMKLTPDDNFISTLQAAFLKESVLGEFLYLQFWFVIFWQKDIGTKAVCKM